jgi:hypothetical protein
MISSKAHVSRVAQSYTEVHRVAWTQFTVLHKVAYIVVIDCHCHNHLIADTHLRNTLRESLLQEVAPKSSAVP